MLDEKSVNSALTPYDKEFIETAVKYKGAKMKNPHQQLLVRVSLRLGITGVTLADDLR